MGQVIYMFENRKNEKILVYSPISIFYLIFLLFLTVILLPYMIFVGRLVGNALSIPPYMIFIVFLLSLLGSHANIKVKETESFQPIITFRDISFFGIQWRIPDLGYGIKKTFVAVNVGGALIPSLLSLYLLLYSVPLLEENLIVAYSKILVAFIVVTLVVHAFARPVEGLGIAVPSFIPPLTAALTSAAIFSIYVETNPFIIAYVGGTLGTLVGADLLNLKKISKLRASTVSIGGAGVFDGVFMTGIMAILLLWLMT
jgi:uncharacterized membrane protein